MSLIIWTTTGGVATTTTTTTTTTHLTKAVGKHGGESVRTDRQQSEESNKETPQVTYI